MSESSCDTNAGYLADATDCDDPNASVNPAAAEQCEAANVDEDCDGAADDADRSASGKSAFYEDNDADGYGDVTSAVDACDEPEGYVTDDTDCDDVRASVNPGAVVACDALNTDEDCDGLADDADGAVSDATDCADDAPTVYPGADEIADDGIDQDCDGDDLVTDDGKDTDLPDTGGSAEGDCGCAGGAPAPVGFGFAAALLVGGRRGRWPPGSAGPAPATAASRPLDSGRDRDPLRSAVA